MNRRYLSGAFALVLTAIVATTIVRCDFPVTAFTSFSYIPRERPRVFVSHHPLRAMPGESVTIRLTPDLRAEDGAVQSAKAGLRRLNSDNRDEATCTPTGGRFECQFTLSTADDDYVYDGHLELQNGTRVNALVAYRFRAAATIGTNEVMPLREPVNTVKDLAATYRVDTAWVHDPGDAYTFNAFLGDVETGVYDGILADPVYRWRDKQLAFYVYGGSGFTSSYYSGLDTRCGQNPWPAESAFRAAFNSMEVIGVLHRHPTTASGVEGTVVTQSRTVFRDCAGNAVRNPNIGTFSLTGGAPQTAGVAKHEYGHAAFGFGDEYTESDATRNVPAAPVPPLTDTSCCCVSDAGSGGTPGRTTPGGTTVPGGGGRVVVPGGVGSVQCVRPGGGVGPVLGGFGGSTVGLPTCTNPPTFPVSCGATPQAACPTLSGDCVQMQMWLGQLPSASLDTARPNVFASQAACEAGRMRASIHPGVEDRDRSLGECHELCGPTTSACPCGQPEAWIVDTNPDIASAPAMTRPDSMASVTAERHGGTCAWCVETSLCVRWQRARGDTIDAAWNYCNAPTQNAAELERQSITLARAIIEWIRALVRDWRF